MTSIWSIWRWAAASNEHAVANARAAATECSRVRLERAEVELFFEVYDARAGSSLEQPVRVSAAGR